MSWEKLAKELRISERQLRDIRKGIYSFSTPLADSIETNYNLQLPDAITIKQNYWYIEKAARAGGRQRQTLYGSLGTPIGRRKGGINSIKTHKRLKSGFILSKAISYPHKNTKLAELVGALLGDGGISLRQIKISLNIYSDRDYSLYLADVIEELFKVKTFSSKRVKSSTIILVISSTKLVAFFKKMGLPIGNKIKQKLDIPLWIHKRQSWQRACLRGLFDTDGCTYIDCHTYGSKTYGHIAIAFKSYSEPLLQTIQKTLQNLGYSPTISTKHGVLLRKEREVLKFFHEIKPSNKRHERVLTKFMEGYRSGHNEAVSKTAVA